MADEMDNAISAEIPNPTEDPDLYELVKSNMIHGPCAGSAKPNAPCTVNGKCSKRYPRPFLTQTQTGDDGYPLYRRRSPGDGGYTVTFKGTEVDNRWVVPFNPLLLRAFNAHINVESCNSVKSIKYICKYVNKGSDQAAFTVENRDEVSLYETGRYISSSEAAWRIFGFSIHERTPPVVHLAVHLENGQRVYFTSDDLLSKLSTPSKTTLMAFFDLCHTDDFAKTLFYNQVPSYYTWKSGKFSRRKQGKWVDYAGGRVKKEHVLGRVYTVHPNNSECYYLRMLLHEIRGPTSFEDLRTIGDTIYPTFRAACNALGLLEDDNHWDNTLQEAPLFESSFKLRELFSVLMVFCQVSDPAGLWLKHRENLAEDFERQYEIDAPHMDELVRTELAYDMCLSKLQDIIFAMGGNQLSTYGLPTPSNTEGSFHVRKEYLREVSYNVENLLNIVLESEPSLTSEQKAVYQTLVNSIENEQGNVFFLNAPGGTGKTFLINLLLAKVRSKRNIAVAAASSGTAATLLEGGRTAHSAFKLPLNLQECEHPLCNISKQSALAQVFRECKLIVWDECTMAHKRGIEALDRTLQDIRNSKHIMGGMCVLLAGDFRQTLPVIPRGTRADEVNACIKSSTLWPKIQVLSLAKNMRAHLHGDNRAAAFSEILLQLGSGNFEEKDGKIMLPNTLCRLVVDEAKLFESVYPDIANLTSKPLSWLRERAILAPKNDSAEELNTCLLSLFAADERTYQSVDSVTNINDAVHYPVEFLQSLNPPGLPPHRLTLKIGAPIMLLRNLNPPKLCNGTRLQVVSMHRNHRERTY